MSTTATPFSPALAACHAGQAARSELDAYLAREAEVRRFGQRIMRSVSLSDLAEVVDGLYAAILASREDFPALERIGLSAFEDAAGILRNAGRG